MAGAELLRVHLTALRNHQDTGEYNLCYFHYERDARLLLSHCRKAEGGVLLEEAEVLARELVTQRQHAWDLKPVLTLLKVLEAQVALGWDGAASAMEECREAFCTEFVATINSSHGYGSDKLFGGQLRDIILDAGYCRDGSYNCRGERQLCGIKLRFLQQRKMTERIEAMQRARLVTLRSTALAWGAARKLHQSIRRGARKATFPRVQLVATTDYSTYYALLTTDWEGDHSLLVQLDAPSERK